MLLNRVRQLRNRIRSNAERRGYRCRLWASTLYARQELSTDAPLKILLDNTVLAAGRVFSTAWFSTGTKRWGHHQFDSGYLGPYPTHSSETHGRLYDHVPYLPGIVYLAERGYIELLTSFEMDQERMHQPAGRYMVRGYFDFNLFGALSMRSVDENTVMGFDWREKPQDAAMNSRFYHRPLVRPEKQRRMLGTRIPCSHKTLTSCYTSTMRRPDCGHERHGARRRHQ